MKMRRAVISGLREGNGGFTWPLLAFASRSDAIHFMAGGQWRVTQGPPWAGPVGTKVRGNSLCPEVPGVTHILGLDPSSGERGSGVQSFWTFRLGNDPLCADPTEAPALLCRGSLPGPVTVYRLSERQVLGGSCCLRSVLPRYRSARPPPPPPPLASRRPKQTPLPAPQPPSQQTKRAQETPGAEGSWQGDLLRKEERVCRRN